MKIIIIFKLPDRVGKWLKIRLFRLPARLIVMREFWRFKAFLSGSKIIPLKTPSEIGIASHAMWEL